MMNQILFVSDIDGTLLKTGQPPRRAVLRAIARFREAGGEFCLCTGRALPAVRKLLTRIPGGTYGILCGGAVIYDFEKDAPITAHYLDAAVFPALEELMAREPDISVTVSTAREIYRIRDNLRLLTRGVSEDRTAPTAKLADAGPIVKVLFTCDEPERLERVVSERFPAERFALNRASTHFYELTAAGVNKASGIRELNQRLGNRRVFAAGDAPSDMAMISEAELFFAPETAMPSVRAAADRIIPAPEAGGLAQAFRQLEGYLNDGLAAKTFDRGNLQ